MSVQFKPDGYHTITPYLVVEDAADAIVFLCDVLGATAALRMDMPDGRIGHAELLIGDSRLMIADVPEGGKVKNGLLHLYVEDSEGLYRRALDKGATSLREPTVEFYGDRVASFADRWGNEWFLATHVEDISEEEMTRRAVEEANTAGAQP
jgi:PhnB protein